MALTTEQQATLDIQLALETARHTNQMIIMTAQLKLDAIRMAQQTLVENSRSKPVGEREITPADIATFAAALVTATNA
jgi:hypothetical protein